MSARRSNKKRRYNKMKIAVTIGSVIILIVFGIIIYFSLNQKGNTTIIHKQKEEPTANLLGEIKILTDEEKDLLDDCQLVFKMLTSQEMSSYSEEQREAIQVQQTLVQTKIDNKDVNKIEEEMNTLAALIDAPLFTDTPGDLFYARGLLILNKEHSAPANFAPGDRAVTLDSFSKMQAAAKNDGINLYDFSNYRSYYSQDTLYNRYVANDGEEAANRYSAKPGYSEHQTGYVMDIGGDNQAAWAETTFDHTTEAIWLAEHAHEYGFILRYPQGKEDVTGYMYESWHFRYVGEIATKIHKSGLTLEEYVGVA